jgi:quinoprotein glucose dehydrogenase
MKQLLLLCTLSVLVACTSSTRKNNKWESYGGSKQGIHYSSLTEFDSSNVDQLQPAWIFHTGDADLAFALPGKKN